jgi:hypothetical protein
MDYLTKLVGHGPQWWMGCKSSYWVRVAKSSLNELRPRVSTLMKVIHMIGCASDGMCTWLHWIKHRTWSGELEVHSWIDAKSWFLQMQHSQFLTNWHFFKRLWLAAQIVLVTTEWWDRQVPFALLPFIVVSVCRYFSDFQ